MLRVRVVVGGESPAERQDRRLPTSTSVCDVLDATWNDAAVSQGLRKSASPTKETSLRQRASITPLPVPATANGNGNDTGAQRKRQKTQVPAEDFDAEAHLSPTPPAEPSPEAPAKPLATKVMGDGNCGMWTATTFRRSKAVIQLTNKLATGYHTSLPCSSRNFLATYSKTLILPVDSSSPEAGEAVPSTGLGEATIGGRNIVVGWAFAHKPGPDGIISGQLEPVVLDGEPHVASRARADLRAVLAAFGFRDWVKEDGVDRLVISTASYHMAKGLTTWLREWKIRQWHTVYNDPVPNRDLWERISEAMGEYASRGCEVSVFYTARNRFGLKLEIAAKRATRQPSPLRAVPCPA